MSECLVGGLPKKREWPFEYQAVFSPIDVIEEYIRPARYVQNKSLIIKLMTFQVQAKGGDVRNSRGSGSKVQHFVSQTHIHPLIHAPKDARVPCQGRR